jgi:hypothetical protein
MKEAMVEDLADVVGREQGLNALRGTYKSILQAKEVSKLMKIK